MNFLDNLVILQSEPNLRLLNILLLMGMTIFMLYSGVLFGSTLLSVIYNFLGRKTGNKHFMKLAKDYVDLINTNNLFGFGLGVVPYLAIIFAYTQLLHGTNSPAVSYMIGGFALYLIGLVLVYFYRHSLHLSSIFNQFGDSLDNQDTGESLDYKQFKYKNLGINGRSAIWGLIFVVFAIWLFMSGNALAVNSSRWADSNFVNTFFNFASISKFLHFVTASIAFTGLALITKVFFWDRDKSYFDDSYEKFAKKANSTLTMVFTLFQPVFFVFSIIITPKEALSDTMFGLTIIAIIAILAVANLLYAMLRADKYKYSTIAFYSFMVVFGFLIVKDQSAFTVANEGNVQNLIQKFNAHEAEVLASMGKGGAEVNGEEIYNGRCIACHKFEEKLVGPPHKEVLPKYMGKKAELIKFLLNPVKINPDYPAMPNQGLKPKEAEAVADYMLEHYGPKL